MNKTHIITVGLAVLLILLLSGVAWASSSANYAINWRVLSGGGAPVSGGNVSLNATLGQTAIGPSSSTSHSLGAGYWYGSGAVLEAPPSEQNVYLPIILHSS